MQLIILVKNNNIIILVSCTHFFFKRAKRTLSTCDTRPDGLTLTPSMRDISVGSYRSRYNSNFYLPATAILAENKIIMSNCQL